MNFRCVVFVLIGTGLLMSCGGGVAKEQIESGQKVYKAYCQTCHMEDGGGVPNMNASLIGSSYVAGDKSKLVNIVLHGSPEFAADTERKKYQNKMPSLANLGDKEIADVLTFVRNSFTNKAPAVKVEDVSAARK